MISSPGSVTAPYRVMRLTCPRCSATALGDGPLHHCVRCKGTWIDEESLSHRVASMRQSLPRPLVWSDDPARAQLPCAACGNAMQALVLFSVPVDRCRAHGVWFDGDELALVLERSPHEPDAQVTLPAAAVATAAVVAAQQPQPPNNGISLEAIDVVGAAIDVTRVASEVATSGILEGVASAAVDVLEAIVSTIVS